MGRYTVKETVQTVNLTPQGSLGSFPWLPTNLPDVAQRKSIRLISRRSRYHNSPSGPFFIVKASLVWCCPSQNGLWRNIRTKYKFYGVYAKHAQRCVRWFNSTDNKHFYNGNRWVRCILGYAYRLEIPCGSISIHCRYQKAYQGRSEPVWQITYREFRASLSSYKDSYS